MTLERDVGLDFGDLGAALAAESFPLTNAELLASHGDHEIEHANGAVRLRSVLDLLEDETYESAQDVRQSVLSVIGDEAIGRKFYSDRETNDTELGYEPTSF